MAKILLEKCGPAIPDGIAVVSSGNGIYKTGITAVRFPIQEVRHQLQQM